jgi:hypothetical protein
MLKEYDGPHPKHHGARALDLELPVDEYIGDLGEESLSDCFGAKSSFGGCS